MVTTIGNEDKLEILNFKKNVEKLGQDDLRRLVGMKIYL